MSRADPDRTRRLYVDVSASSVLILCHECPHWYAMRFTRFEAWRAGRDHEQRAHPGAQQAAVTLAHYETRGRAM